MEPNYTRTLEHEVQEHSQTINKLTRNVAHDFHELAKQVRLTFDGGNKLLIAGNGGSAADAQHLAAELVLRFRDQYRKALPAIALSTDSSILTACSNDYSFDHVFSEQVDAIGREGDMLLVISTSGQSENLVQAVYAAEPRGLYTFGLLGGGGGLLEAICDNSLVVPSMDTARVQEMHILLLHALCATLEDMR